MKVILLNECDKYIYPEGIDNLDDFVDYAENSEKMFTKMKKLFDENGLENFFIDTESKDVYINFDNIATIEETEVNVVNEIEFFNLLKLLEINLCTGCNNNGNEETGCDSIINKRDKLDLDANICWLQEEFEE